VLQGYDVGGKEIYVDEVLLHRDPISWGPRAEEFWPDRWLDPDYVAKVRTGGPRALKSIVRRAGEAFAGFGFN
jgi:hypothetical protein